MAVPLTDLQVAHFQLGRFGDARPGVVEEEQKRVFAPPPRRLSVGHLEHRLHLRPGQPSDRLRHGLLRRDGPDVTAPFDMGRIAAADEAGEGPDGGQPLIAGPDGAPSIFFEMREELQHHAGT